MNPLYIAAEKLLKWDILHGVVKDVVVDPDTNTVALVVDPLKAELHWVKPQFVRNVDFRLNTSFAQHFGIPLEVERWPNSHSVRMTRPMWFHGETNERNGESGEPLEDFLSGLEHGLRDVVGSEEESIRVVLISYPGYPYIHGRTRTNYSAKTKKEYSVGLPHYAMQIKDRDGKTQYAVNFCKLLSVVCANGPDAIAGRLSGDDFLVTHATHMYSDQGKMRDDAAEILAQCPGMLFPSLATGIIPAANFGETILVVRPDVILGSLKPYKEKGAWKALTFNSDVWTETAGAFVNDIAILAWKQMHSGDLVWYYVSHLYVLGPEIKETGFGNEEVKPLTSTKQLAAVMRKKYKMWRRDLSDDQITALGDQPSGNRYGYLETKLNIILGWDCIPIAVCPEQVSGSVKTNLAKYGFKGKILAVPLEPAMQKAVTEGTSSSAADDIQKYRYSWIVRDVIMEYATKNNLFFNVTEG